MNQKEGFIKKDTLRPGTTAEDGRRNIRVYIKQYRTNPIKNQVSFYTEIISALSMERMESYGDCNGNPKSVLARYLLNMALCESLYQPIQYCEVALRNSIHQYLTKLMDTEEWYDSPRFNLTDWAEKQITGAKEKITKSGKTLTPGRIVAELHFGFWTSFFEAHYEQKTLFLPSGIKGVFPYLPKSMHNRKKIKGKLDKIRLLRNRVFHHERIIHWKDLNEQHRLIMDTIGTINPELLHLAEHGERFNQTQKEGLTPWLKHLDEHWMELKNA